VEGAQVVLEWTVSGGGTGRVGMDSWSAESVV